MTKTKREAPQDGIERARDGQYSCATCGMFMLEPCEHWKLSPELERLVNEADDDIREGPGLHRWAVREAIRQAAAAQSQEIAELKEQARLREAQTEEARAREAHEVDWWADWLIDAVAYATQDRRYLRGEEHADNFAIEAIIANGKKAIEFFAASEVSRVRRETLALLQKHEWDGGRLGVGQCPICSYEDYSHLNNCWLAAAIRKLMEPVLLMANTKGGIVRSVQP